VDGAQTQFPGQQQLQDDGQRHAALMQSLMQAAAAGMGPPMMHPGRAPGMPGQLGLIMQQVSSCFSSGDSMYDGISESCWCRHVHSPFYMRHPSPDSALRANESCCKTLVLYTSLATVNRLNIKDFCTLLVSRTNTESLTLADYDHATRSSV